MVDFNCITSLVLQIGSMEIDLPRLYQIVQQCGGLNAVIKKERWHQVADIMKIPKLAQDRITKLDRIYCRYLLPYDVLSHGKYLYSVTRKWIIYEVDVEKRGRKTQTQC